MSAGPRQQGARGEHASPGARVGALARVRAALAALRHGPAWAMPLAPTHASAMDLAMMDLALAQARDAGARGEVPIGAVVYRLHDGAVLGTAGNTREAGADPAGHAELHAIREAARTIGDFRLSGCGIAVTLEPCAMCAGLIVNARLDRLVFGAFDAKAGFVGSHGNIPQQRPATNHTVRDVVGGVRGAECAALLGEFFRALRRQRKGAAGQSTGDARA